MAVGMLLMVSRVMGADYQASSAWTNHWAFKAPVKPAVPNVHGKSWVRDPIDDFVLARLEQEKLKPSPEADKMTLLRRLSLDLIGLPPTIAELEAFLADKSANAYEKQVDRLLASPHYGERWGRHWLDAARYADSDGYEKDKSREMWFYRDWVVKAFNDDMPYNKFIIEQIAGEQLPNATQQDRVATGFLRNSMVNEEGAIDPEQFRMEAMFDRMDAIGRGVLGLTIQCAQCHNHKFDPLTQEEYYRMMAYLNNDRDGRPIVYTPSEMMKIENIRQSVTAIEGDLRHQQPDWEARMAAWEKSVKAAEPLWTVLTPDEAVDPSGGSRYYVQKDSSILSVGYAPVKITTRIKAKTSLTNITAIRLEVLTDPTLPRGGPGRSYKGTFGLSEFKVSFTPVNGETNEVRLSRATADYSEVEKPIEETFHDQAEDKRTIGPVSFAIDGKMGTAWTIDAGPGRRNADRKAVFELATNLASTNGGELIFTLEQAHGGPVSEDDLPNIIGRMRFSVTDSAKPVAADPIPKEVRDILDVPPEQRTREQREMIFGYYRKTVPEFKEANAKIKKLLDGWPNGASTLTLVSLDEPRETHILKRGDSLKPDRTVTPGVPAFLHQVPSNAPPTRMTFANWLVDPKSPTTARVFVNRTWQEFFGIGLLDTPEDFGMRADEPSHPRLLDWLACEFMERGWSIKAMQKLIVMSATYRQSSRITPEMYERDPYNRLLARGARYREDGEAVRDIALASSGLLNPEMGGPSVYPPAPAFLFQPPSSFLPFHWNDETNDNKYRRALYTFRRRSTPYPVLQTFDTPNGESSCVRRQRSDTPLQALTTLNEGMFVECAQALALRTLREGGTNDTQRATFAFRCCEGRKPAAAETDELLALLKKEEQRISDGWLEAKQIGYMDPAKPPELPEGATPTQLAAWTMVSRVILNLDETITRE